MKTILELEELRKQIHENGKERGYSIALDFFHAEEFNEELTEETEDQFIQECYECETNARQFSPFEFTAKELNDLDREFDKIAEKTDNADNILEYLFEPWKVFDDGIAEGMSQFISAYKTITIE